MAMPVINNSTSSPSFKEKLKSSICCFRSYNHHHEILEPDDRDARSPYEWRRSATAALDQEIKEKCLGFVVRRCGNRRRLNKSNFKYDITSYTLNFDDDHNREEELPLSNFSMRAPVTPELRREKRVASASAFTGQRREVYAWS